MNLGTASDVGDCKSKCVAYGSGCTVIAFKAADGSCFGYNLYTGTCA